MEPSRSPLPVRAAIYKLAEDLVQGLFDAVRTTSLAELDQLLGSPASPAGPAATPTATRTGASPPDVLAELTPRQRSVFERALHGSRNADIARDLGISVKTVQTHRAEVNSKLGVRSTPELVRFGAARGLLNASGEIGAPPASPTQAPAPMFNLSQVERVTVAAAMVAAEGDRDRAAGLLGISRSALDSKLRPSKPAAATPSPPVTPRVRAVSRPRNASRGAAARANESVVPPPDAIEPPPAPPAPPVRAGEEILRAAGGGVVIRRRGPTTP